MSIVKQYSCVVLYYCALSKEVHCVYFLGRLLPVFRLQRRAADDLAAWMTLSGSPRGISASDVDGIPREQNLLLHEMSVADIETRLLPHSFPLRRSSEVLNDNGATTTANSEDCHDDRYSNNDDDDGLYSARESSHDHSAIMHLGNPPPRHHILAHDNW